MIDFTGAVFGSTRDLLEHVNQDYFVQTIGWIITVLFALVIGLLGTLYRSIRGKITSLYEWKDETVDPALRSLPERYVSKEDLRIFVHEPNVREHNEIIERLNTISKMLQDHIIAQGDIDRYGDSSSSS